MFGEKYEYWSFLFIVNTFMYGILDAITGHHNPLYNLFLATVIPLGFTYFKFKDK